MAVINVGAEATDRDSTVSAANITVIGKAGPANDSGVISSVEIWSNVTLQGVIIAIFEEVSANHFTARDQQAIANVEAGAKRTFGVSLNIEAGDFIGLYYSLGKMERCAAGGSGYWALIGDYTECIDEDFGSLDTGHDISLKGIGATGLSISEAGAIASLEAFGSHQLNLKLEPSSIVSLEVFGSISMGVLLQPSGIASLEAFGTAIVAGPLTVSSIASLETFGTAQLNLTIYPFTIIMSEEFGIPGILGALTISGIASLEAFGAVVIAGPVTCEGIVSIEEFGLVVVTGPLTLTGVASLEAFGSLVVMGLAVPPVPMRLGYILELHDSDGTLIAVLHEAYNINYTQLLNAPHSLSFALKGDDTKLSYLTLAREIWLRDYKTSKVTNKFKMTGRVDTRT